MLRILMVCMGNICRSPMAEEVTRVALARAGLAGDVVVDSAGTHGYHAGEPPDERARQVAAKRGYDLSRLRARKVVDEDFQRFDLLLAMDRDNLASLERRGPADAIERVRLFLDFAGGETLEVPDPYYGNLAGFERVLDLCEAGADGLVRAIRAGILKSGG